MSNEIKNTLFRFVSMRAPELNAEYEEKANFINQKATDKGQFNEVIENIEEGTTKRQALLNQAQTFEPNALEVEDLKTINPDLYKLSIWLAKNKNQVKNSEIEEEVAKVCKCEIG